MPRRILAPTALLPALLLSCGGGASDMHAHRTAFTELHTRLVRTQGLDLDGEALHDHLSAALVGRALTRAFLQAAQDGRRRRAEGATVRIDGVEYEDVALMGRSARGTEIQAAWVVTGTITHADHSHRRATRYRGRYAVVDTPAGPRLAEERPHDATRLPAPPPARTGATSALDLLGGAR